jgi:hypothetical protein
MLCLTFDNFGCGVDFGHGQGIMPPSNFPDQVPPAEWARYPEIGVLIGHPRFLQLLKDVGVKATFFAEGYSAKLHSDVMKAWADDGHEIAIHGWKHEIWAGLSSEREAELIELAVEAVTAAVGQAPVGFRPPGLKIGPNTDAALRANGILYVSQVASRTSDYAAKVAALGVKYDLGTDIVSTLPLLPCSDDMTDTFHLSPTYGGVFGTKSDEAFYDELFERAKAHETNTPDENWVFIAHPFASGNRGWFGFERFIRGLAAEFGPSRFRTGRELALA